MDFPGFSNLFDQWIEVSFLSNYTALGPLNVCLGISWRKSFFARLNVIVAAGPMTVRPIAIGLLQHKIARQRINGSIRQLCKFLTTHLELIRICTVAHDAVRGSLPATNRKGRYLTLRNTKILKLKSEQFIF